MLPCIVIYTFVIVSLRDAVISRRETPSLDIAHALEVYDGGEADQMMLQDDAQDANVEESFKPPPQQPQPKKKRAPPKGGVEVYPLQVMKLLQQLFCRDPCVVSCLPA